MDTPKSPLTGSDNVRLEKIIDKKEIIKGYLSFKIDVSKYFSGTETVSIYKCLDTGYRFYYPFNLSGDSAFYEHLQKFDWFYMDWKWEYGSAEKYIKRGDKVLEMGCGNTAFIKKMSEMGADCVGLELNEKAVQEGSAKGLTVLNQTMQDHAKKNPATYDVICSFQTIECISNIREVLEAMVMALKKGGRLIFGVPNNDSFIKLAPNYLNMPPQHMGLWNEDSLASLTKIFPLKRVNVSFEPIQKYHESYFIQTVTSYYLDKFKWMRPLAFRIIPRLIPKVKNLFSPRFKGFTILTVFEKI